MYREVTQSIKSYPLHKERYYLSKDMGYIPILEIHNIFILIKYIKIANICIIFKMCQALFWITSFNPYNNTMREVLLSRSN